MTLAVASLAGVPLTVGFLGKFLVFKSAVASGQWLLIGVGIIAVGAGFYYYLKVVTAMYWEEPNDSTPIEVPPLTSVAVAVLAALIVIFGVFPAPVLSQLRNTPASPAAHVAQR
jgi:NADH-quinone oxidoreductase subunit N